MGRGPWSQALAKGKAVGCTASILFHPLRILAVGLAPVLLTSFLAPPPLGAVCTTCDVSIQSLAQPDLKLLGTSAGACAFPTTRIEVSSPGTDSSVQTCSGFSCSVLREVSVSCLPTGSHTANASCVCGKWENGSCVADTGTASVPFSVNSTPTVEVSSSPPAADGAITLTVHYNFPNTVGGDPQRRMELFFDGASLGIEYGSQISGSWTKPWGVACASQGSHEVKVKAVACPNPPGDETFKAEAVTTVQADHEPSVHVTVEPLDPTNPGGLQNAIVEYSFPQTFYDGHRLLRLLAYPSGGEWGWTRPLNRDSPPWVDAVSCFFPGDDPYVEAIAVACPSLPQARIEARHIAAIPGCPRPPRKDDGCGKSANQCCLAGGAGPGGGGPGFGGDGKSGPPSEGPGARLRYLAGGAGSPGNPGRAAWNTILGRGWSHDYAERIVQMGTRAWLITRDGGFREYTDANNDGFYEKVLPEDEYRILTKTAAGWSLRDLSGTVSVFDASGLWKSTADPNGNAKTATYTGGRLTQVTMPDGRSEAFAYHASGKLASITEIGVAGADQRTWSLTWSGNDLVAIEAPDGTGQRFVYAGGFKEGYPGYMIRRLLMGVEDNDPATPRPERVEQAWEYDTVGNVVRTWRGSNVFATGVERYELAYDRPVDPTQTTLTIHRTETEREVVVYTLSRMADFVGAKARVTSISGDCSSCGLAPNSQLFHDDPANPLLPTRIIDGNGTETQIVYDSHGRVLERTEAAGTPLSRTTTWTYSPAFPALPTRIEAPSTAGGAARRTSLLTYDAAGNLTRRREQGAEAGSFFDLETVTTFHPTGQPLSVDPPGYGDGDETSFTWDSSRGHLIPLTRTEPLVGATTFEHDSFNRRIAVIDPNGVRTETTYDALNRILSVTQKGVTAAEDLTATHKYNALGDLLRTTLPRGNVIEYGYDGAGRLVSIERKPDVTTPGERTLYTLDQAGHRIKEELQRWDGAAWVTESWTEYQYQNRCQIGKVVHADGKMTEYAYDCDGKLEKVWDANHLRATNPTPTQLYQYDALDRLTSMTQPWTGPGGGAVVTSYAYDVQDHLTAVTDAEGNTTTYNYSDRDLITKQTSPVSGVTTSSYNEHGEMVAEIDARSIVMTRSVDALDRVTALTYPNPDLDVTYTYDDPAVPFSKGRLTRIDRNGETVDYLYDRFGRTLQDGALAYQYDANGNPASLLYPGGVEAVTTYDYADRPATLVARRFGSPDQPLVMAASYLPSGPLSSLTLGNGLTETRSFNDRYFPSSIVAGGLLSWSYSTDGVGNILSIADTLNAANNRTYGYQDFQYFLTLGNGAWGPRAWTYDKIGNRLSETRGTDIDGYAYLLNSEGGNRPQIEQIALSNEPAVLYSYDEAGNVLENGVLSFAYGDDRRLSRLAKPDSGPMFTYDGRGYLSRARVPLSATYFTDDTVPTYNSEGLLLHRLAHRNVLSGTTVSSVRDSNLYVFYFAGRPVATLDKVTEGPPVLEFTATWNLHYLTVDHLGTPILVTDPAGAQVWQGGFEPFGADYSSAPTILRFPGQWSDATWNGSDVGLYYNVHRWYEAGRGGYTQPDPVRDDGRVGLYSYSYQNPVLFVDPLGLRGIIGVCCEPLASPFSFWRHCYIRRKDLDTGRTSTIGLHTDQSIQNWIRASWDVTTGRVFLNNRFDQQGLTKYCYWDADPCDEKWNCARLNAFEGYPRVSRYYTFGPNSNTFARVIADRCNLNTPPEANPRRSPGWNDPMPAPPTFYYPGPP